MGRSLKTLIFSFLLGASAFFILAHPVFATANSSNPTESNQTTSEENPDESEPSTPTESTESSESSESTESTENQNPSCLEQISSVGWLVCPSTGALANLIDNVYSILESLLTIKPISTDANSPIHLVWGYLRNITNIIFIIFFIIIIYSQLTGLGINNYGIKRTLPRIIIAAILINLSYYVCVIGVDLSNIIGSSLRGFFLYIEEQAITNGTISDYASTISVAGIVTTILGIGTVGAITLSVTGGIVGLIWLIIPVVFSGAIAVISAVAVVAARQALVSLLIMISPLAIVCYLLPNTERWFHGWLKLLIRMLVFFPIFSILYGASQLAGLVIITSATNWLGIVLGVAVQVIPLFATIPLLRMSGTVLSGIDHLIHDKFAPLQGSIHNRSAEGRALAKQKQLSSTSNLPHNRLARWLERRRANREFDLANLANENRETYLTNAATSMFNKNKKLNRRGIRYYNSQLRHLQNQTARANFDTDMDEGFSDDGSDSRIRKRDLHRIKTINTGLNNAVTAAAIAESRKNSVSLDNMEKRANRIRSDAENANSAIHQQITSAFRYENNPTPGSPEEKQVKKAVNAVLSDAISAKRKVDSAAKSNYLELYDDMPAGPGVNAALIGALKNKDYNSMTAAISIMEKRADHGNLIKTLIDFSPEIANDQSMQKYLSDALITMKGSNSFLWAWSKANNMRRGKNGAGKQIAGWIDLRSFLSGNTMPDDIDTGAIYDTSFSTIASDIQNGAIATQDRKALDEIFKLIENGTIPITYDANGNEVYPHIFQTKYMRSAATSGVMDGDQLSAFNRYITGGYDSRSATQSQFFNNHKSAIKDSIIDYLANMGIPQIVNSKASTFKEINGALLAIDPNSSMRSANGVEVSTILYNLFNDKRRALEKPNAINTRSALNAEIRDMIGVRPESQLY